MTQPLPAAFGKGLAMDAPPFVTFGRQHVVGLALVLGGSIALPWAVRASRSRGVDRAVRWTLAATCLGCEGWLFYWLRATRAVPLKYLLPLHLCDVSILIAPLVLVTGNRLASELLYFWGIGGAIQALITPTVPYGFPDPGCVGFFGLHGLIIASALHVVLVMRYRPTPWSVPRVWLITNLYGLAVLGLNKLLETNYLFIMWKPRGPTLLDALGPWPWYVVVLDLIALGVICLCYAPFFVRDRLAARAG